VAFSVASASFSLAAVFAFVALVLAFCAFVDASVDALLPALFHGSLLL